MFNLARNEKKMVFGGSDRVTYIRVGIRKLESLTRNK